MSPSPVGKLDLSRIDPQSFARAIAEFKSLGRTKFLSNYGFGRSSKFYLLQDEQLFDTKSLVAASYYHATGTKLRRDKFSGGRQANAAIQKAFGNQSKNQIFEDRFGELKNVTHDFDRLSDLKWNVRKFGFSKWIGLPSFNELNTRVLPGVYVIAACPFKPHNMLISDKRVVYIGETVNQNLSARLHQFYSALKGARGHSGGETLRNKGYGSRKLWLSIRSFPLKPEISDEDPRAFRSSQIQLLEKLLLHQYVMSNNRYPTGNTSRTGAMLD